MKIFIGTTTLAQFIQSCIFFEINFIIIFQNSTIMSPPLPPTPAPCFTKEEQIQLRYGDLLNRIKIYIQENDVVNLQRLLRQLEAERRLEDIDFPHIFHWAAQYNRPSMFNLFMCHFSYRLERNCNQRGIVWRLIDVCPSFLIHVNQYFNVIPFIDEFYTLKFSKN